MDAEVYPITRWGVQRAAMDGARVRIFRHHDATALAGELVRSSRDHLSVVVTDGFCPGCGRVAPLREYQALARRHGAILVVDDTQALGILGHSANAGMPYGYGGGGSLRWSGIGGPETLVYGSLAKGLGVPVAVLAGTRARVGEFKEKSLTRVHCSPPSCAALRAGEHAIDMNRNWGDILRHRLASLVQRFRDELHALGIAVSNGLFPIQTLALGSHPRVEILHQDLEARGLRTVLRSGGRKARPRLTLLLTAGHLPSAIERAAEIIGDEVNRQTRNRIRQSITLNKQHCKTVATNRKQTYERYTTT